MIRSWRQDLSTSTAQNRNQGDRPNYWAQQPSSLITTSRITSINFGTGDSIYQSLQPALESVSHELILVTCFWARSRTLTTFNNILRTLSRKGEQTGTKIRVRICFSSSSLWQKLFHTFSRNGQIYVPESWPEKLGLPPAGELPGLDMEVKSIFFLPFCVMHPKFIILDRKQVFLPSCNVSWEDWFEGCIGMTGPIVEQFVKFWSQFWASPADQSIQFPYNDACEDGDLDLDYHDGSPNSSSDLPMRNMLSLKGVKTLFLPSPHHINPCFRFPWQQHSTPPPTPLNAFLLRAIALAKSDIYIQTPNLTSAPVILAILNAIQRQGVNIHIVTSERLMILEQLVTAGTTTSRCVKLLIRRYEDLAESQSQAPLESARPGIGQLKIEYYEPRAGGSSQYGSGPTEPVQSHLKCTIIDEKLVVLGSGNLDRASWYTSQELGLAFFSTDLARTTRTMLETALHSRKKVAYDSGSRLHS